MTVHPAVLGRFFDDFEVGDNYQHPFGLGDRPAEGVLVGVTDLEIIEETSEHSRMYGHESSSFYDGLAPILATASGTPARGGWRDLGPWVMLVPAVVLEEARRR